jgi:hypothetical protein
MRNIELYKEWLISNDFHYQRFDELVYVLTKYIQKKLDDENFAKEVASKFSDVIKSCDDIDYEEDSTAVAYAIIHFLPRYHRFQMIFDSLLEKNLIPIKNNSPINILDIGTGPGPTLFALSDLYLSLKLFGQDNNIYKLKNQEYIPDYVERSSGFRNWLHHFTEIANQLNKGEHKWIVPYHHGTFHDFNNIKFEENHLNYSFNYNGDQIIESRIKKYRFDIVLLSNFLTQVKQVDDLSVELENCMRFMRHNGKLIVVGANGSVDSNKDYVEIYKTLKNIILNGKYSNHLFQSKAEYLEILDNKQSFYCNDRYGTRIKDFNKVVLEILIKHNAIEKIEAKFRSTFEKSILDDYKYQYKWQFHIFEKHGIPKHGYLKVAYNPR